MSETTMLFATIVIAFCREAAGLHGYFTQISYSQTEDWLNSQIFHRNFTKTSQVECLAHGSCELI